MVVDGHAVLPWMSPGESSDGRGGGDRWGIIRAQAPPSSRFRVAQRLRVTLNSGFAQHSQWGRARYSTSCQMCGCIIASLSGLWLVSYFFIVLPAADKYGDDNCQYKENRLADSARFLVVYFAWFILTRLALLVPCIGSRVARVRSQTHGFCRTYCVHLLVRDGPLFAFVAGSLLLWFHLDQSPSCQAEAPELYSVLKPYAVYSGIYSLCCLILASWHNNILMEAVSRPASVATLALPNPAASKDMMEKLEVIPYRAEDFGDEDGQKYPAECAICLLSWEESDVIKVTPCHHVFHQECLGNWLQTATTCALCRRSLGASCSERPRMESSNDALTYVFVPPTAPSASTLGRSGVV